MKRLSSWNEYYKGRGPNISNIFLHWQYLTKVILKRPKRLLEVGCGPAEHSLFIKKLIPSTELSLLDLDPRLLALVAKRNSSLINKGYVADVTSSTSLSKLRLKKYDMVISQGLMEHFPDKKFVKAIENIGKITRYYLFSVPSNFYPTIDYGNEILRSSEQMKKLLSHIPRIKYKVSPYIDIGFRTKFSAQRRQKMNVIHFLKYLLFDSSHLLIEIKYH